MRLVASIAPAVRRLKDTLKITKVWITPSSQGSPTHDARDSQINYLFLSIGNFEINRNFTDNGEGLDLGYALAFYGRWKSFLELQPLLQTAVDAGEEARVVSCFAAGVGGELDESDMGVRKSWSIGKSFSQGESLWLGLSTWVFVLTSFHSLRL